MKLRYLKAIFLFSALLSAPASASSPEAVTNFTQEAVLSRSGSLQISQTIDYDFGSAAPHSFGYSIPLTYHDDQGREFRMGFILSQFSVDGQKTPMTPVVTVDTARITLPAGSGSSSSRRYILDYRLSPVVLRGQDADILKLNVTGLNWPVPINQATLKLETPTAPADNLTCYAGASGSTTGRCSVDQQGNAATVTSFAPLQPGEGLSVYANFAPKSFDGYLMPYEAHPSTLLRKALELVGLILAVALAIAGLATWRRRRYTKANETS